jgi:hypothetical protein
MAGDIEMIARMISEGVFVDTAEQVCHFTRS